MSSTNNYAVRITHSYEQCKNLVTSWSYQCKKMLVYEHVGSVTEKVHIHLVIEESEVTKKWLRELGTRQGVDLKGNKNCSFKPYDGNVRALVYMTKGVLDPKFNKGYSDQDIAHWKSLWEDKPKSRDQAIYDDVFGDDEYNEEMYTEWKETNPEDPQDLHHKFKWVKSLSYKRALMNNGFIVNIKTINEYKMLVYTYCARHNIFIPDDPVFKHYG